MNQFFNTDWKVQIVENKIVSTNFNDRDFLNHARSISEKPLSVILMSGGDSDCSRYSIIGCEPNLVITSKGRKIRITSPEKIHSFEDNPFNLLNTIFEPITLNYELINLPFMGGALGYLSYELKNHIEKLPQHALDDLNLPDLFLIFPTKILIHDRHEKTLRDIKLQFNGNNDFVKNLHPIENPKSSPLGARSSRRHALRTSSLHLGARSSRRHVLQTSKLKSNFSRDDYIHSVNTIRDYIREGDVYQVNLSQRFSYPFKTSSFNLFQQLYQLNPAPFFSHINAGDHQVVSTSMERFLFLDGSTIETRPIKGTRKRGITDDEDSQLKDDLISSEKEDAELSMIVDLLRNDLGKVCKPGSIKVHEHKRVEKYQNVFHLVSIIKGELADSITFADLLKATFPGGSITGCPKIRAMEIIDELEPHVRQVYTGAIGYMGFHKNLDLNVAIRTAIISDEICHFGVGGGIVYDSVAGDEYEETLYKGQSFFDLINGMDGNTND